MTFQLFPELKRILEDKRIKGGIVPLSLRPLYLSCEQFVVDLRDVSVSDEDVELTFADLKLLSLHKTPCSDFIIHVLTVNDFGSDDRISSVFFSCKAGQDMRFNTLYLSEDVEYARQLQEELSSSPEHDMSVAFTRAYNLTLKRLVVFLATQNAVVERRSLPRSRISINGFPHKKGSGGYTLLSCPKISDRFDSCASCGRHVRAHFRRGHIRRYDPLDKSSWIWVKPSFVHGVPEVQRAAYLSKTQL